MALIRDWLKGKEDDDWLKKCAKFHDHENRDTRMRAEVALGIE